MKSHKDWHRREEGRSQRGKRRRDGGNRRAGERILLLVAISAVFIGSFIFGALASAGGLQMRAKASGRYLCRDCGQYFDGREESHTRTCGKYVQHSTSYACDTCGGSFSSQAGHSRVVLRNCATEVDHYFCTRCGTVNESSHTVTVNRNCASAKGYNCSKCGHVENSSHTAACTGSWRCTGTDSYIVCPSCGSTDGRPDLPCSHCGKKYPMPVRIYYECQTCGASRTDTMVPENGVATYTTEDTHNGIPCTETASVHYYCSECGEYKADSTCYHGVTAACYGNVTAFYRCSYCSRVTDESCTHSVSEDCPADSWSSSFSYRCSGCGSEGSGSVHTVSCPGQIVDAVHTLTYDISSNGGTGASPPGIPGIDDGTVLDSENSCWNETAEKAGYDFVGWNTDKDAHKGLSKLTMDADKTLYAIFRKKVSAILHDIQGEKAEIRRQEAFLWNGERKASVTFPPVHERNGWAAVGWKDDKGKNLMDVFPAGSSTDISGNTDFYALYKKTVSFPMDADGDGVMESTESADIYSSAGSAESMEEGEGAVSLPAEEPVKQGYVFGGWKDENGDGNVYQPGQKMPVKEDSVLVAVYTPISYTVKFHGGSAEGDVDSQSFTYDEAQRLAKCTFEKNGYDFLGWSMKESLEGITYADGQEVKNLASESGAVVDLYAVHVLHRYEIYYEGCEGAENINQSSYTVNDAVFALEAPVKEGYLFLGWTSNYAKVPVKEILVDTSKLKDMAFRANWQAIISVSVPAASELTLNGGKTKDTADLVIVNHSLEDVSVFAGFADVAEGDYELVTQAEDHAIKWSSVSHKSRKMALYMEGDAGRKVYAGEDAGIASLSVIKGKKMDSATLVCRHASGVAGSETGCSIGRYAVEWQIALPE